MVDIVEGVKESLENYLGSCSSTSGWELFFYPRQPTMGYSTGKPVLYVGNPTMESKAGSLGYGLVDVSVRFPIHMYSADDTSRQTMTKVLRDFTKYLVRNGFVTNASFEYTSIMSVTDRGKYHSRANLMVRVISSDPVLIGDPSTVSCQ